MAKFPFQKVCLERCLGPAKNERNVMANWILTKKSTVISWRLICRLTLDEYSVSTEVELSKRTAFNADVREKLGTPSSYHLQDYPSLFKQIGMQSLMMMMMKSTSYLNLLKLIC